MMRLFNDILSIPISRLLFFGTSLTLNMCRISAWMNAFNSSVPERMYLMDNVYVTDRSCQVFSSVSTFLSFSMVLGAAVDPPVFFLPYQVLLTEQIHLRIHSGYTAM